MAEFKKLFEDKKPKEPYVPSKALIANMGGIGCVLDYTGDAITWHIREFSPSLDELGLDDAPDGLSVWEGTMGSVRHYTQDGEDWDFEANGKFRDLNPEEWAALQKDGCLWPKAEIRKCENCGYSLYEYEAGETLCGACADEKANGTQELSKL